MVSCAKILLKTGVPSGGQPTPTGLGLPFTIRVCTLSGWHSGEEKFLKPLRSMPFGMLARLPDPTVPGCTQFPPAPALYGNVNPSQEVFGVPGGAVYEGITVPRGIKYALADPKGAHVLPLRGSPSKMLFN